MKYMADTHMHSIYSYDGQMKLEDMIKKGVELGLKYMIFTEHLELNQIKYSQFLNRYNLYSEEIDILQEKYPKLKLLKGIEFSNPEMYLDELEKINELETDYIIGSNHILPKSNGKKEILKYYERILKMIQIGGFDCLGHLDYIRRKYSDNFVPKEIFIEIFESLIDKDIALEINTSAHRRCDLKTFPNDERLKLYQNLGGKKVTLGSDAHRLNEIYDFIPTIDNNYDFDKGIYVKRKFISLSNN